MSAKTNVENPVEICLDSLDEPVLHHIVIQALIPALADDNAARYILNSGMDDELRRRIFQLFCNALVDVANEVSKADASDDTLNLTRERVVDRRIRDLVAANYVNGQLMLAIDIAPVEGAPEGEVLQ